MAGGEALATARAAVAALWPRRAASPAAWAIPVRRERPAARSIFLTFGPNPSFDYYFRARLAAGWAAPAEIVDSRAVGPDDVALDDARLVICRYLDARWRRALAERAERLAALALFVDDDYAALARDPALPLGYRLRVARNGLGLFDLLARRQGALLVSTPELARRHAAMSPTLLAPHVGPLARPPATAQGPLRLVFHATASHLAEHRFVVEIARRLRQAGVAARFDAIAPRGVRGLWREVPEAQLRAPLDWPSFRALGDSLEADLLLAPLEDTALNRARSATKAIDAARLGAAGLFADLEPYAPLAGHAPLLPRDPAAWAQAIAAFDADRVGLAAARARLRAAVEAWPATADWPAA